MRTAIRVVPAWFCSPSKVIRYCQMPTIEVTTPIARPPLSSVGPCSICASRYPMWRPRSTLARARPARPASRRASRMVRPLLRSRAASMSSSLTRADIGPGAEEMAEMSFLVAPGRDLDGAGGVRIGIDDAGGFERIDDAERPIEPARVILAFEMRAGQQFRSGFRGWCRAHCRCRRSRRQVLPRAVAAASHLQRAHMRLREGRLVNAGLVGADAAQRIEIAEDPGAVDVRGDGQARLALFRWGIPASTVSK